MVEQPVSLGFGGIEVPSGAHICAFYRGRAGLDEVLVPYLAEGMRAGEKCLGVVESSDPADVFDLVALAAGGPGLAGQVDVRSAAGTYLQGGRFASGQLLEWLGERIAHSLEVEGFDRARSVGEMTWARPGVPGADELFAYETELNRFAPSFPQVVLCLYDLDQVGGAMLIDTMKTHPRILVGTLLCDSPFYVTPETAARR